MNRRSDATLPSAGRWTSLAALMLILLFAGAADGLMEAFGPAGFPLASAAVLGAAWALVEVGRA